MQVAVQGHLDEVEKRLRFYQSGVLGKADGCVDVNVDVNGGGMSFGWGLNGGLSAFVSRCRAEGGDGSMELIVYPERMFEQTRTIELKSIPWRGIQFIMASGGVDEAHDWLSINQVDRIVFEAAEIKASLTGDGEGCLADLEKAIHDLGGHVQRRGPSGPLRKAGERVVAMNAALRRQVDFAGSITSIGAVSVELVGGVALGGFGYAERIIGDWRGKGGTQIAVSYQREAIWPLPGGTEDDPNLDFGRGYAERILTVDDLGDGGAKLVDSMAEVVLEAVQEAFANCPDAHASVVAYRAELQRALNEVMRA